MFKFEEFSKAIRNYKKLGFEEYKYSYLIVKPNGNRHISTYIEELKEQKFEIFAYFSIFDYETINTVLHPTEKEQRHIRPINDMFHQYYGNFAILIIIGKKNIEYNDFVLQVFRYKSSVRQKFETNHISYVFDISTIMNDNQEEFLKIISKEGKEMPKREMNEAGTFLVFSVNSLHSPDPNLEITISELELLINSSIIVNDNLIPKMIVELIVKYESFAFLKDM